VTIRHGGIVRRNDNGDVEFEGMREFSMLFSALPSYGFLVTKLKGRLQWSDEGLDIVMQGVIDVGSCNGPRMKRLVSIGGPAEWNNYVSIVMETEVRALDLIVRQFVRELPPRELSPIQCGGSFEVVPPEACEVAFTQAVEEEEEEEDDDDDDDDVGGGGFADDNDVGGGAFADDEGGDGIFSDSDEADLHGALSPLHDPEVEQPSLACQASNHHNICLCDDDETYERVTAVDSDDDRVVPPPSPRTIEIMKRLFPGRDPLLSHFRDLRESHRAVADGGALEDDIPRPESSTIIQKGHVFKDIKALKMWLREYVVVHNRPYRVKNSHAARRYIITCESTHCQWKIHGRKMKGSNKFKITSVVGLHTCGSVEPNQKHRQLTSKFIANRLLPVVKQDPTISIHGVLVL
jgi:hypothetical protein